MENFNLSVTFDIIELISDIKLTFNTSRRFWKECVLAKPRKDWQLNQWTEALLDEFFDESAFNQIDVNTSAEAEIKFF